MGGCVKTLLFLKNHKALTFTSQGFAMSKSMKWVTPLGRVFKIHDFFLHGFEDVL